MGMDWAHTRICTLRFVRNAMYKKLPKQNGEQGQMWISWGICVLVHMYVCILAHMHVSVFMCMCVHCTSKAHVCVFICVCVCIRAACVYLYVYSDLNSLKCRNSSLSLFIFALFLVSFVRFKPSVSSAWSLILTQRFSPLVFFIGLFIWHCTSSLFVGAFVFVEMTQTSSYWCIKPIKYIHVICIVIQTIVHDARDYFSLYFSPELVFKL